MVYVQRNAEGQILRVEYDPFEEMNDTLAAESRELQRWLNVRLEVKNKLDQLRHSDLDMIRVLEDALYILIDNGVVPYTKLPEAARIKLDQRALVRADLEGLIDHPESL
ncbi:MAG: tryptophan synthase subunit beta [Pseudomonas sp.]|uniref:tryptophan synthase subunit beta n=1 Tax=Pseudomonas sp. TaxID=306 RepID=UPI00339A5245